MAAFSNYLETQIISHIFRDGTYAKPSVLAIALLTTAAGASDTGAFGNPGVEVANAGGYARQAINPSNNNWAAPVGGTTSNSASIVFPTATGTWGTVIGVAIVDSTSYGSGNLLFYGSLSVSKTVTSGDTFKFNIGDLSISLT